MHRALVGLGWVSAACAAVLLPPGDGSSHSAFFARERERPRAHIDSVDAELRARDASEVTVDQRRRRDTPTILGFVGGVATFAAGAYAAGTVEATEGRDLAAAAAGVGGITAAIALWRAVTGVEGSSAARTRTARRLASHVTFWPTVIAGSRRAAPALVARVSF